MTVCDKGVDQYSILFKNSVRYMAPNGYDPIEHSVYEYLYSIQSPPESPIYLQKYHSTETLLARTVSERFQSVHFAGNTYPPTPVVCSVPLGSVLGALFFLLYTSDIGSIASKHHINSHSFADDTELYLPVNPKITQLLRPSIVACISKITEWCAVNKL